MPLLFTEQETAEQLRIEITTLRNLRRRKRIRGFKQGNKWFYKPEAIREYLNKSENEICGENHNSLNSKIEQETSSPIAGISAITEMDVVSASLRAAKLARKITKQI